MLKKFCHIFQRPVRTYANDLSMPSLNANTAGYAAESDNAASRCLLPNQRDTCVDPWIGRLHVGPYARPDRNRNRTRTNTPGMVSGLALATVEPCRYAGVVVRCNRPLTPISPCRQADFVLGKKPSVTMLTVCSHQQVSGREFSGSSCLSVTALRQDDLEQGEGHVAIVVAVVPVE